VWVDDLIIATADIRRLIETKKLFCGKFKMKDLGILKWFLGIRFVVNDERTQIEMNQTLFIERILAKFGMQDCKPKAIPCDPSMRDLKQSDSEILDDPTLFRQMVGSLIYIMTGTRPDISYCVTFLSQFLKEPLSAHLTAAKHVLRYLKGSINYKLTFAESNSEGLYGFCDADWEVCQIGGVSLVIVLK
jgi:hypothetical protein